MAAVSSQSSPSRAPRGARRADDEPRLARGWRAPLPLAGLRRRDDRPRRVNPELVYHRHVDDEQGWLRRLVARLQVRARVERAARFAPARLAVLVFASIIVAPMATPAGKPAASFVDALFTATSAVCVTGLSTVDTATAWSTFGQGVIILGAAVGGLGIMTMASLLSFAVSRHVGLTQRMLAATENQSRLGDVASLLRAGCGRCTPSSP